MSTCTIFSSKHYIYDLVTTIRYRRTVLNTRISKHFVLIFTLIQVQLYKNNYIFMYTLWQAFETLKIRDHNPDATCVVLSTTGLPKAQGAWIHRGPKSLRAVRLPARWAFYHCNTCPWSRVPCPGWVWEVSESVKAVRPGENPDISLLMFSLAWQISKWKPPRPLHNDVTNNITTPLLEWHLNNTDILCITLEILFLF